MKNLFTSESVTEGHPDKLCDYISDAILDLYLEKDSNSRVACEAMACKDKIIVSGEIASNAKITNELLKCIIRDVIKSIGYDNEKLDMNYKTCKIDINLKKQSQDIALGVNKKNIGAGDQGIMFGYACSETKELMPISIMLAHKLAKRLTEVRKQNIIKYLRPDGKVQVTVEYKEDMPIRIDTIVISTQHEDWVDLETLKKDINSNVILPIIDDRLLDMNTKYYINPTGRFVIGGPLGDTGLTGRKIIVDTYGGYSRHGGGAFSGKDATKVDKSGSYIARHIAKNIVANGLAEKCEIQLAYAIGISDPVSIYINTFNTCKIENDEVIEIIFNNFDLTPQGIINYLELNKPIYKLTTNYGHFGKEDMTWEKIIELKK